MYGVEAIFALWIEDALIFGPGLLGLLIGVALKMQGVSNIAFCNISENRLELAASFGFEAVANGSEERKRWRQGADLAAEATGVPAVAADLTS